jgi:Ca2+-binding EF-hand superfamily protein
MISYILKCVSSLVLPLAAVTMTFLGHDACAQPAPMAVVSAQSLFGRSTRPGETLTQYMDARRAEFRGFDVDGDGAITEADLTLHRQIHEAGARATALSSLLQCDFDSDGAVTREEVETFFAGSLATILISQDDRDGAAMLRQHLEASVKKTMASDTNNDGRIDSAEMLAYAEKSAIRYTGNPLLWVALALDEDKDGRVTPDEYLKAAEAAFHKVDSDGNEVVSREEIGAFRKQNTPTPNTVK